MKLMLRLLSVLVTLAATFTLAGTAQATDMHTVAASWRPNTYQQQCLSGVSVMVHEANRYSQASYAFRVGACGPEVDLRSTRDHVIVLNHNDSYNGRSIANSNYAQLSGLMKAKTLINMMKRSRTGFGQFENKRAYAADLRELIRYANVTLPGAHRRIRFTSGRASALYTIKQIDRRYQTGLIRFGKYELGSLNQPWYVNSLMVDYRALQRRPSSAYTARRYGVALSTRHVDTLSTFRYIKAHGVRNVVTYRPSRINRQR